MSYQIAIPSHARSVTINQNSLRYLADEGIDKDLIRVFVAEDQLAQYRRDLDPGLHGELVVGGEGIRENHNAITMFYPEETRLVRLDDDVRHLALRKDEKTLERVPDLDQTILFGFDQAEAAGASIWGVYPIANPFFMKDKIRTGLTFLIGQFFGAINYHDEMLVAEVKGDYERSIQRYLRDGRVLRFEFLTAIAGKVGGNKGGLQSVDRASMNERSTTYLLEQYPDLVSEKKSRASGYREIRLRNG